MTALPLARERQVEAAEVTTVHTRILRCMLAAEDCAAYWRHVDPTVPPGERARVAFDQRWFGLKSEARVRTIMTDMLERFDAFPEALAVLRAHPRLPPGFRTLVCHVHTQLADPVYRAFTGVFLPHRRFEGRTTVDRVAVASWVEESFPGRWSPPTVTKFASNLLATAFDVGLVRGRRDPRLLPHLVAARGLRRVRALPPSRRVRFEGSLTENPYLHSLGFSTSSLVRHATRLPGVGISELGGAAEIRFGEASLGAWARGYLEDPS